MATTKSAKIEAEIEKVKAKIAEQQTKLKELEQRKVEAENSEIVDIVRGMSIPLAELPLVLQQLRAGKTLGQNVPKSRSVDCTSLPHTSQPGGICRANSSTRGRSPMRATILSRASSGFLLWASIGEMINW